MIITEQDIEARQERTPVDSQSLVLAALAIISRTRANWRDDRGTRANDRASAARAPVAERRSANR